MPRDRLASRLLVPATFMLAMLAAAVLVLDPALDGFARGALLAQTAPLLAVWTLHRAHRRHLGAIETRLDEVRRLVQMLRAANENGAPGREEPAAASAKPQ
jgi:hypothetical protein